MLKCRIAIAAALACAATLNAESHVNADVVVFGVDYGYTGQDVFTDHQEATGPNTNGTVPRVTSDGSVTASLTGTDSSGVAQLQYRAPGQTSRFDVDGTSFDDLVEDLVAFRDSATSAATGNGQLTLTGLAAGTYTFRSYHNENVDTASTGFAAGQTITAFIGGDNKGSVVPLDLDSGGGPSTNTDADLRFIEFGIFSNGIDPIVIDYTATGGSNTWFFLNGFTISVPSPAALPAGLAMLGLIAAGRRRTK